MSFKSMVAADIDKVFLNIDENAAEHIVEGETWTCIFDEDKSSRDKIDGVYKICRRLFISANALSYRPVPKQKMKIDGEYYYVVDCIGNDMLEIVLEARQT